MSEIVEHLDILARLHILIMLGEYEQPVLGVFKDALDEIERLMREEGVLQKVPPTPGWKF